MTRLLEPAERLWRNRRITDDGCWEWTAALLKNGYGHTHRRVATGVYKNMLVHRLAYEVLIGPIPEHLEIDHLCRNRACFNPMHLEAVTHRTNTLRGESLSAQQARQTMCGKGLHPLSGDNLAIEKGRRVCRACRSARKRRYYWEAKSGRTAPSNRGRASIIWRLP